MRLLLDTHVLLWAVSRLAAAEAGGTPSVPARSARGYATRLTSTPIDSIAVSTTSPGRR